MSDEARNVEILKAAYQRWSESKGASVDDWMEVCAANIAFGSLAQGTAPGARYLDAYNGREALKGYFTGLAKDWQMVAWKTEEFIAQGDRVIVLSHCTWRYTKTGKEVSTPKADCWRMAGGKAIQYFEFYDTAQVHAASA